MKFSKWLKNRQQWTETGAGAGGVYVPGIHIDGSWQGSPGGKPEPLSSVGNVKPRKKKKKKHAKGKKHVK